MADLIDIVLALNPFGNQLVNGIVKKEIVKEIEDRGKCPEPDEWHFEKTVDWCGKNPIIEADALAGKESPFDKGWVMRNLFGFREGKGKKFKLPPWGCLLFGTKPGSVGQFVITCIYIIPTFLD